MHLFTPDKIYLLWVLIYSSYFHVPPSHSPVSTNCKSFVFSTYNMVLSAHKSICILISLINILYIFSHKYIRHSEKHHTFWSYSLFNHSLSSPFIQCMLYFSHPLFLSTLATPYLCKTFHNPSLFSFSNAVIQYQNNINIQYFFLSVIHL